MDRPYVVTSLNQLLAIASPGREDIVDAVGVIGPCTVPDLARFLGRSRQALYYHVRALRDCGLLLETHQAGEGKKLTARYDLPGRPLSVRYDLSTERARRAVIALGRARLRGAARGFVRACSPGIATLDGPRRNLWVARWKGWLSDRELEEANRHLSRLIDLLQHHAGPAKGGRRAHEITFAIAPIVARLPSVEPVAKRRKRTVRRGSR
ncbi:MAG: helix-turn-helix transcriptional regulator [Gemmatimonadales bacterium]|nr:helix-turn-helix transcriptional regulator [Gemmatimonadales bacterium]MDQ3426284.1 helix-turn-helix domain-containing protein [Gemmatimonadota bacterium]